MERLQRDTKVLENDLASLPVKAEQCQFFKTGCILMPYPMDALISRV
jgi:hypothetical protein